MSKFQCKRCGKCCGLVIPVTEQDVLRWAVQYREDILRYVSPRDHLLCKEDDQCPFLRQSLQGTYICAIYRTRPAACARFPLSEEQANRIGCSGWPAR